jgi:SAM-dependent methyltransferase
MVMQLKQLDDLPLSSDFELIGKYLPTDNASLVELGCGAAFTTRLIAEKFPIRHLLALEVDDIQHEKNLRITDLPKVTFDLAGMEAIPADNDSFDGVIMLKSLHHVPADLLADGFKEVHRVLKPGGKLYISEPVFAGEFNEILRLFNDEEKVRELAFDAIQSAIESGLFSLDREIHFLSETRFIKGFEDFDARILKATHSVFNIDDDLYEEIRSRFEKHVDENGSAYFRNPMRVDILQK